MKPLKDSPKDIFGLIVASIMMGIFSVYTCRYAYHESLQLVDALWSFLASVFYAIIIFRNALQKEKGFDHDD